MKLNVKLKNRKTMRIITVNGRIAADVTRQVSKQGTEFINFSIANTEYGDPKSSDGHPQTQWFRVTSFLPQHVNLAQHLKKGKPITVIGKYSNRLYQNQNTGQWNISNDVIASEICFEIGSERQDAGTNTSETSSPKSMAASQTASAVDSIPQATSRTLTSPKNVAAQVNDNPLGGGGQVDDDDLPF